MEELLAVDKLGRKIVRVDKHTYCIQDKMDFFKWLEIRRSLNRDEFMKLRNNHKEQLFLVWKWGYSNDNANYELETTRRSIMMMVEGIKEDWYFDNMKKFEYYCFQIKKEIGLIVEKKPIDFIVEDAIRKDLA